MASNRARSPAASAVSAADAAGAIASKMPSSASEWPVASPPISAAKLKSSPVYMRTPARQARAQRDLLGRVEQRHLDAVHLRRIGVDHRGADVGGARVVGIAREAARADPVAGERRVEHLAQPVQDDRRAHLRQHASVDQRVVVGRARAGGERAARHQDDAAAGRLDRRALLLVGGDDLVERAIRAGRKVVGAGAREDDRARNAPRFAHASAGSARARSASRAPCRAARCPSPRRRRSRATTGGGGRRASRPSRRRRRATDRSRRADRRRRAPRRTRRDSSAARPTARASDGGAQRVGRERAVGLRELAVSSWRAVA